MAESDRSATKVERLVERLRSHRALLIVMQDNPDPDAIASAAALRRVANAVADLPCSIAYGGVIGRAENRALVGYLGLNFRSMEGLDPSRFDGIALVDTQPGTGNNALPSDRRPDIVLDHHPLHPESRGVPFLDVRTRYGAVSTMMFEYLRDLEIVPDAPLATALLYGIRTDTHDLGRSASRADIAAAEALYSLANTRMLGAIQRGSVAASYFTSLWRGLDSARLYGAAIVCDLGDLSHPDRTGEMVDLLMRHERVRWAMCYGAYRDRLLISVRTEGDEPAAGELIRRAIGDEGTGGGHARSAGAQVPLNGRDDRQRARLAKRIRRGFVEAAGQGGHHARPLVSRRARRRARKK